MFKILFSLATSLCERKFPYDLVLNTSSHGRQALSDLMQVEDNYQRRRQLSEFYS